MPSISTEGIKDERRKAHLDTEKIASFSTTKTTCALSDIQPSMLLTDRIRATTPVSHQMPKKKKKKKKIDHGEKNDWVQIKIFCLFRLFSPITVRAEAHRRFSWRCIRPFLHLTHCSPTPLPNQVFSGEEDSFHPFLWPIPNPWSPHRLLILFSLHTFPKVDCHFEFLISFIMSSNQVWKTPATGRSISPPSSSKCI